MAPQSQPSSEGQSQARDHPFLLLLSVGKVKKCTNTYRNITDQPQLLFFITFFGYIRFIFYSQLLKIRGMRGKPSSDLEKHKDTQSPLAEQRETHFLVRAFEMAVGSCVGQLFCGRSLCDEEN